MRVLAFLLSLVMFGTIVAPTANAAPITFDFVSGTAHITAIAGATSVIDEIVTLNGGFVDFDPATPEVLDFLITLGTTPTLPTLIPWGNYDNFVVESASFIPGLGFTNAFIAPAGPNSWNFLVGPVDSNAVYSAWASVPPPAPVSNIPAPFIGASFLNGSIDSGTALFEMQGITLMQLDGAEFGEPDDLIFKADITWSGVLVPEPSTALLLGLGLVALGVRRRSGLDRQ